MTARAIIAGLVVALVRGAARHVRSLVLAVLLAVAGSGLAADPHEDFYVQQWFAEHDGVPSETAPNGERIDCLTSRHVVQFAKRGGWREAARWPSRWLWIRRRGWWSFMTRFAMAWRTAS